MFDNIMKFFKKLIKAEEQSKTKYTAKERLHLVLMQDRANVSAEYLALMKQEIIEVIKKYVDVDENQIDVKLTNQEKEDGTTGVPVLYANIPILGMKEDIPKKSEEVGEVKEENTSEVLKEKEDKTSKENSEENKLPEETKAEESVAEEVTEETDKNKEETVEEIIVEDKEEDRNLEEKETEETKEETNSQDENKNLSEEEENA